jgi:superfamily II DNA or RNA helicase
MKPGLYDYIVNRLIEKKLHDSNLFPLFEDFDSADSHEYLSQYLHKVLVQGLSQIKSNTGITKDEDRKISRIHNQISICNQIIDVLDKGGISDCDEYGLPNDAKHLLGLLNKNFSQTDRIERPDTPLNLGALLTGTRQDPSLVSQLKKEIVNADRVDILCSFIKWSGIRILEPALRILTQENGKPLRVITTSYMGATDQKAVEFLSKLSHTRIKISYDTHRTRLHAKAYLFKRDTGFSCAYIGSSNISNAALTEGLEWNIKVSEYEQSFQWEKISATFDTYWNDAEFEDFTDAGKNRLQIALKKERDGNSDGNLPIAFFDLRPYTFQQEIVDKIFTERVMMGRKRHLVVAATGTGKTMVAAFIYKQWVQDKRKTGLTRQPRFLFVAHRKEILEQSIYTFRAVLKDQNFGDLVVGEYHPVQMNQIFVSIQSLNSKSILENIADEHYEFVIVDEFHHAAAKSYQTLLKSCRPEFLLGLTATPERADGEDITQYFDNHISAEIRLPDAINRKLLCPFQYFGVSDSIDYSTLKWQRGGYVASELEILLTGDDIRARLIIDKTHSTLLSVRDTRGLGFCVSQNHARYMADSFTKAGIPADFLISTSSREHRNTIQNKLKNREINFIFVVDLYNEGVDIPEIDTVLFLRPTESLTVFLQQLGRGLRLSNEKDCLTVLDFVGQCHKKFRFDLRFKALINNSDVKLEEEMKTEFPHLPAGCTIQLERQAQKYILDNIKQAFIQRKSRIIQNIAYFTKDTGFELSLSAFLKYHHMEIDTIYKSATWARLCAQAGVLPDFNEPDEAVLAKGLRRLCFINDEKQIRFIRKWLISMDSPNNEVEQRRLMMFLFTLLGRQQIPGDYSSARDILLKNPTIQKEIGNILEIKENAIESIPPHQIFSFICPLSLHCSYSRDEILAGLGYWTLEKQTEMREGVLHLKEIDTDIFMVTLNKSEKHYSPTTMYDDYAISNKLFHWQSQSTIKEESLTGQRYIHHKKNNHSILLFVREDRTKNNVPQPYYFLGQAEYVAHTGSKPMSITWELKSPMPAFLIKHTNRMVIG